MDTLLCNQDGKLLFGDATSGADTLLSSQETLAFFYTGSATQATYTWNAEGVTYADILIVGGGGGSQSSADNANARGGGGGGEVVFRQGVAVSPNTTIKVGRGGPIATNGGISEFGAIQANGGGTNATAGGSGGGANRNVTVGGVSSKLSVDGMGNAGGVSIAGTVGAAGGGGAMEPGFTVPAGGQGSNGGQGYTANVFGVWNTVYGSGGGGGARNNTVSLGGTNGGAGGSGDGTPAAQPGVANTGGGAGGAGANGTSRPGAVGGSGIVLVKPNPGILDGLGSSVYSTAVGAYAMRRLFGAYTGPQARLRRSTDSAEINVYFDKYGRPVNFDLDGWLAGATGYVVTWYDQSLGGNHVTQTTTSKQPKLVGNKIEFVRTSAHSLSRTPGILTAGDDTYTFAGNFEPKDTSTQVVFEQNALVGTTSKRSCVILLSGKIGHNGENNDAHDITPYILNQQNRFVMRVNNGVSPNIRLNREGTNYTKISTTLSGLDVSGDAFGIGFKLSTNSEYYDGFMSHVLVFRDELSDTQTNTIISLMQLSNL